MGPLLSLFLFAFEKAQSVAIAMAQDIRSINESWEQGQNVDTKLSLVWYKIHIQITICGITWMLKLCNILFKTLRPPVGFAGLQLGDFTYLPGLKKIDIKNVYSNVSLRVAG